MSKIRFTYFNDTHVRSSRPRCRVDKGFYEGQFEKLKEAFEIVRSNGGYGIHGGDFFHLDTPALGLVSEVRDVIDFAELEQFWINPGNHDLAGGTVDTFYRSGLAQMKRDRGVFVPGVRYQSFFGPSSDVIVRAVPYMVEYPDDVYMFNKRDKDKTYVIVTHDMVTTRPMPYPHKLVKDVKTNADIVLCSHWHSQFIEYGGPEGKTLFVNSGPLDAQTVMERGVKPAVAVIDIKDSRGRRFSADFEFLKTTGYEEIEVQEEEQKDLGLADDFIREVKESELADGADLEQQVRMVAKESGYTEATANRVLERVKNASACVDVG